MGIDKADVRWVGALEQLALPAGRLSSIGTLQHLLRAYTRKAAGEHTSTIISAICTATSDTIITFMKIRAS
eukprot:scaffold441476_cov52-Prasinocladus_malaysianus.AAC.1